MQPAGDSPKLANNVPGPVSPRFASCPRLSEYESFCLVVSRKRYPPRISSTTFWVKTCPFTLWSTFAPLRLYDPLAQLTRDLVR